MANNIVDKSSKTIHFSSAQNFQRRFGLLGKTLQHSFSKSFFEEWFRKNKILATYENFELESAEQFPDLLAENLSGLNVTLPYKERIIPFLDELSQEAQEIGAVNCIQFLGAKTIGHNTDAYGFHQLIKPYLTKHHQQALILGNGGASKSVEYVLKKIGIDCVFVSRTPKTARQFQYSDINNYMLQACKLIVNCTPIGMFPNTEECIEFPFEFLTPEHLVIDLIYNPPTTRFLKESQQMHAQTLNGHSMLVQQARRSWEIWNG